MSCVAKFDDGWDVMDGDKFLPSKTDRKLLGLYEWHRLVGHRVNSMEMEMVLRWVEVVIINWHDFIVKNCLAFDNGGILGGI